MDTLDRIFATARKARPQIVLSEGEDPRVVEGALRAARDGLAQITLLRRSGQGEPLPADAPVSVIDPQTSEHAARLAKVYHDLRKHKGLSMDAAAQAVTDPLVFAALMVREGLAAGTIGGAVATTADTVRHALQIIGGAGGSKSVSSCFLMLLRLPEPQPVIFADCALVIEPTAEGLADIAVAAAESYRALAGGEPKVAMLSFSTNRSARHPSVDRVIDAVAIAREKAPDLIVDGDLQFDAALMPDIGAKKFPGSPVAGAANVFVFPNLAAGNIGYKIAQRVGGAVALGPILQGLAHPANDLSRGCSAQDVYQMIGITAAQAAAKG